MTKTREQEPIKRRFQSRRRATEVLGFESVASTIRLEKQSLLKPIRLSRSPTGKVFYSDENLEEVIALLKGAPDAKS